MSLTREKPPTLLVSKRQKAMSFPSGLQRKPSRMSSSSSLTQSEVPLMTVAEPSVVSRVILPEERSSTQRSLARTQATRPPSGENFANISVDSGAPAPSLWSFPVATSMTQ